MAEDDPSGSEPLKMAPLTPEQARFLAGRMREKMGEASKSTIDLEMLGGGARTASRSAPEDPYWRRIWRAFWHDPGAVVRALLAGFCLLGAWGTFHNIQEIVTWDIPLWAGGERTAGKLIEVSEYEVDGPDDTTSTGYEGHYTFQTKDGRKLEGSTYWPEAVEDVSKVTPLVVEYLPRDPRFNRVVTGGKEAWRSLTFRLSLDTLFLFLLLVPTLMLLLRLHRKAVDREF